MRGLDGKVALITGAGQGIGRAIARRLAQEGAKVAVTDIDEPAAQAAATEIGLSAKPMRIDVTDLANVRTAVAAIEERIGPIDVLVNNAGWDKVEPFLQSSEETWAKVLDINLRGPIHCAKAVLPAMVQRGRGRIVNISSDAGRVGSTGEAVYSAAKAGIIGFTKTLAREMSRHQINVNAVCPGPTNTPLMEEITTANPRLVDSLIRATPFGRLAEPDEIAAAVAFFASEDARFITGQTLSVSGGLTMV